MTDKYGKLYFRVVLVAFKWGGGGAKNLWIEYIHKQGTTNGVIFILTRNLA